MRRGLQSAPGVRLVYARTSSTGAAGVRWPRPRPAVHPGRPPQPAPVQKLPPLEGLPARFVPAPARIRPDAERPHSTALRPGKPQRSGVRCRRDSPSNAQTQPRWRARSSRRCTRDRSRHIPHRRTPPRTAFSRVCRCPPYRRNSRPCGASQWLQLPFPEARRSSSPKRCRNGSCERRTSRLGRPGAARRACWPLPASRCKRHRPGSGAPAPAPPAGTPPRWQRLSPRSASPECRRQSCVPNSAAAGRFPRRWPDRRKWSTGFRGRWPRGSCARSNRSQTPRQTGRYRRARRHRPASFAHPPAPGRHESQ
ncbi:hypothetical protein D9M70_484910 [compost metagenome]